MERNNNQTDEKESTPKQILFDFIPVFLEHIDRYPDKKALIQTIGEIFAKKNVFFWSSDEKKMQIAKDFSFLYDTTPKTLDFVYPVFTSISGNKSDRYMQRTFTKDYEILGNCDIQTTFQLDQKHVFPLETQTRIASLAYTFQALGRHSLDEMLFIAGKWPNKQYIRFLLPKEARLSAEENMTIRKKDDMTIVTVFLTTLSGGKSHLSFSYTLPNPKCLWYSFTFQKQPGLQKGSLEIQKNWISRFFEYTETDLVFYD